MIAQTLKKELNIADWQVNKVMNLIDEGKTIPFIARYRKDVTGSLNDEVLRKFDDRLKTLRNLEEKKEQVLKKIEEKGKLTDALKNKILNAKTLVELEDLYRPYKSKKNTRASIAKEKGLESLAKTILEQNINYPLDKIAQKYVKNDVKSVDEAIDGAKDIIAEIVSENSEFRKKIRKNTYFVGNIKTKCKDSENETEYELYYNYEEKLSKIPPHRILAINRGESEKILSGKIDLEKDDILIYLKRHVLKNKSKIPEKVEYNPYTTPIIEESIEDSYKRLIFPAIEREIRNCLTDKAEKKSIEVFKKNLEQLLMERPISSKTILGWDSAFRTGCKLAVINSNGKVLDTSLIYPTEPQNKVEESKKLVKELIKKYDIDIIAIGNGTASKESEKIVADIIKGTNTKYIIVNEAGASVYSASKLASEEFPEFNEGERSAISIARRLQDPLAELVKIDPKSIGVGQYQHDMNQKRLNESLKSTIEKVVNEVGVDLNTASSSLLNYISGISKTVSKNIVEYRENNGAFKNRKELLNVKKLGDKTFEQCAGFIKVPESNNPLDNTTIHPESYKACFKFLRELNYDLDDIKEKNLEDINYESLSADLDIGLITLKDIVKELKKPGRDPREDLQKPILRKNILGIENLKEGMVLEGTVRNIVDFGAFVDIGVHQDGLVHISQIVENKFIKHPLDILSVGDIITIKVVDFDIDRKRISLTMIL
ncbi:MAG: RNA-binding transcriptional accessory protein [Methanobacteriaceae archaeon]|jgi:uncharacterized protein|nr:RNA-binding transcriptional accessory protein [Methanobacteriaceae archaeon]